MNPVRSELRDRRLQMNHCRGIAAGILFYFISLQKLTVAVSAY